MVPAPTLSTIFGGGYSRGETGGRRLVSVLLATPHSGTIEDLRNNVAYFNARSGYSWDLHVAGYYAYGGKRYDPNGFPVGIFTGPDQQTEWWFSPKHFNQLRRELEDEHRKHIAMRGVIRRPAAWTYSGDPELVSMWATETGAEWNSLVANHLTNEASLGNLIEHHSEWSHDRLPDGFRPGERPNAISDPLHTDALRRGLSWAIAATAGAALSEGVNILIDKLTNSP